MVPLTVESAPIRSTSTHGSGCTFSAAVAALLGQGHSLRSACLGAKRFVHRAIAEAPGLGGGHGPVDPNWPHRMRSESLIAELIAEPTNGSTPHH